jgi:PAS domain S-box-containing protein
MCDALDVAVCLLDPAGTVRCANRALAGLLGRPLPEITGRRYEELVREAVGAVGVPSAAEVFRTGREVTGEVAARGRWFRVKAAPVRDEGGAVSHAVYRWVDVTERRRTEQLIRTEHAFRKAVEDSLLVGVTIVSPDGRQTYVNPAFCRMVGWGAEELLGAQQPFVYWPPEESGKIRAVWEEAAGRGGAREAVELRFRRRNGERFPVSVLISPLGESGRVSGWLAAVYDLSEHRRADWERTRLLRERAELADQLGLLLESTAEGIYGVDRDGRCTFINRSAARMLGWSPGELLGQRVHGLIHHRRPDGSALPEEECPFCHPPPEGQTARRKGEVLWRRGGDCFPVEFSSHPIVHEGVPAGAVVSFADLSDRELLEEQLRQAQKMEAVGRLAGGVAHDFNNLLTAINGYSELLLGELPEGDHAAELVEEIRKAGERAAAVTRQLLIFSRRQVVVPSVLDLGAVLTDMEKMLRHLIGADITCTVRPATRPALVKMDRGQVQQIVLNLAVNARDAMPRGGELTIQTGEVDLDAPYARRHVDVRPGPYVLLSVTDTGCGMTEEVRVHLFEPFFTTKEVGKGTGLGLSTVYGIVKQNQGHIEVDSTPGRGTSFKIYLPRAAEPGATAEPERNSPRPRRGSATVLVAEDEDMVRGLIRMVLQWNGYKVLEARDGGEALELCEQHSGPIDLLITDLVMPQVGGCDLAVKLQQRRPGLRVLYISGYTGESFSKLDLVSGGSSFLQKPFTPDALAQTVGDLIDRPV